MKGNILKAIHFAVCLATGLTSTTFAGPLRSSDVPENPAWVVHLDCDTLRSNAIGKFILAEMEKPENQSKIAAVTAIFGVDLRTQIHGLTLYAAAESAHEPVLLLYGDFDTNRLVTLAKAAPEYDAMEHGQHTVHSWLDEKKKKGDGSHPRVYAALPSSGLIIFSARRLGVSEALDVLDKKAENIAANKTYSQLLKPVDEKTFFQAAAPKMILPASDPHKGIADLTTHARLSIREGSDQVAGVLSFGGKDEEVARNMVSIAQGITGLIKAQQEKPKLAKLAEKVSVKQEGAEMSLAFAAPSDQVVEFLAQIAAAKMGKH